MKKQVSLPHRAQIAILHDEGYSERQNDKFLLSSVF